jgi:hypothetical protein
MTFATPVAFFIFNRPDVTQQVFDAIRKLKPAVLLVVGDGARSSKDGENALVEQTRKIVNQTDWNCDLRLDFVNDNLGCKRRVSSGLGWIFQQFEEAIILEDDCVPDASFFPFCQQLLERYRNDERVFSISGNNFQSGQSRCDNGYYFSKYFHCWGWASWRRVYQQIDWNLACWSQFVREGGLLSLADSSDEPNFWERILGKQANGEVDSWAYTWLASCWMNECLNVLPDVNLVSNIGFSESATHTRSSNSKLANLPTNALTGWSEPTKFERNFQADRYTFQSIYRRPNRLQRLRNKIVKQFNRWHQNRVA